MIQQKVTLEPQLQQPELYWRGGMPQKPQRRQGRGEQGGSGATHSKVLIAWLQKKEGGGQGGTWDFEGPATL